MTAPFLLVIGVQGALATVSVDVLSNVRAYVGGESLWTKGQKDAIYYLGLYAQTHDERHYRRFEEALAIPLGDRAARRALEQTPSNRRAARAGFLAGGNDPADVDGLINLFAFGRAIPYFSNAIEQWRATDPILDDFVAVGGRTRLEIALGEGDGEAARARIEAFNERMTPLAMAFSKSLGQGSRAAAALVAGANVAVGALLYGLLVWRTRAHLGQRRRIARALKAERERAAATLEEIGEAVLRIDGQGRLRYLNPAAQTLVGFGRGALGLPLDQKLTLLDPSTGERLPAASLLRDAAPRGRRAGLTLARGAARVPVSLVHTRVIGEDGAAGAVLVLHDMSHEQEMIERLAYLAAHDHLTGLANRRKFETFVASALRGEMAGRGLAIALIDLDHFKSVNDSGGHAAGDALLAHAAALLRAQARSGDLIARLGGDEFGAVLVDCDPDEACAIAEAMRNALAGAVLLWQGKRFGVSASIGLLTLPPGAHEVEAALQAADQACYRAKAAGRNCVEVSDLRSPETLPPRIAV